MDALAAANNNNSYKRKDCPTDNNQPGTSITDGSIAGGLSIKRLKEESDIDSAKANIAMSNNINNNNNNNSLAVSTSLQLQQQHHQTNANGVNNSNTLMRKSHNQIGADGEPTSVIRVIIENMLYPVTLEALHEVFQKAGKVDKIVTFTKNGKFQSLVQFNLPRAAQIAKSTLDKQNIYPNACSMRIDYSTLTMLNVRYNNDKSRDFTNPNLPQGSSMNNGPGTGSGPTHNGAGGQVNMTRGGVAAAQKQHDEPTSSLQNPIMNGQANGVTQHNMAQHLDPLLGNPLDSANLPPILKLATTNPSLHPSFNAIAAAVLASFQRSNQTNPGTDHPSPANFAALANGHGLSQAHNQFALAFNNFQHQSLHQQQQQQRIIPCGPVLLASNLDEQLATPEALFTLFGVFGDVIRVKILFNKKDNALIQMAEANQAQVAQSYLDKQRVFGKNIRVTRSKHQLVQMPRDGNQSDAGLTKDFTNSPLHRFKIPGSRNYLNIYPPSNTLHVSNIPASVNEIDMNNAFKKECGFEFATLKFFPKDRKMALIKFNSVEHATIALIKMHDYQISEDNHLRVSFSKSPIHE